jgi:polysaccharide biosynthesis transport protein
MASENKIQLYDPAPLGPARAGAEPARALSVEQAEGDADLRAYWRVLRKRRWTVVPVLLASFTLVLIATVKQERIYRASTLLEIGQENPNVATVQQLFQFQTVSDDYLETQYKILQSDTLARQVVEQLHLAAVAEFNPPRRSWFAVAGQPGKKAEGGLDPAQQQAVLKRFRDNLSIDPIRRSRLVRVSFDSQDAQLAAQVVNALAAGYIQENLETHWEATQKASEWLSQQLDGLKIKLEKSEDEMHAYAQANSLVYLESDKGSTENIVDERLRQLQSELTQAQADRYQKESLYRLVQAGDYGALPGVFDNKVMQDLTVKLADLERQKAELAPNFNPSYPRMKEIQNQIDRSEQFLTQQRAQAARHIADEYFAAIRRETLVRQAFEDQMKQAGLVAEKSVQYNILKREVDTNKQLYEGLLQRLKEAGVSAGLKASNIRIVDRAFPPTRPVRPWILLNLSLGLVLGLGSGIALAFLQEHMDNTLKTPDDIEQFLRLPALGMIPSSRSLLNGKNGHHRPVPQTAMAVGTNGKDAAVVKGPEARWIRVDAKALERSVLAEAFRSLRTSVLLSTAARPPRSLAVVSAQPSEGKTTVCSNLAIALAQLGKRVLVVDGDMRRPSLHDVFSVPASSGLVNYLTGTDGWLGLVRPGGPAGLDCLVCGPIPPNPSELLSSGRMQALVDEAMTAYDFVLLDSPPLLNVADGRILITLAEGTILVVRGGTTPRDLVHRACAHTCGVGGRLIGVVLNDLDLRRDGYYSYDYYESGERSRGSKRA